MEGRFSSHSFKFFIIFLALNSFINSSSGGRQIVPQANTEFIRTSCSSTTYPKLCFDSLSTQASLIKLSPQLLVHSALNVTLSTSKSTTAMMVTLSKSHGLNPREVDAMQDCVEELSDTVDQLRKSISEMGQMKGSNNFELIINDIQTWVSAALTDENTCSDGFQGNNMNGKVMMVVRTKILTIAHLTSNALALINNYASLRS